MVYVHGDFIDSQIHEYGRILKGGPNKGNAKNPALANDYTNLKNNYYMPMRDAILAMTFNENNVNTFQRCAKLLNQYYAQIRVFMRAHNMDDNSKFHTNFLEEFSIYFLDSLIPPVGFDIFNKDVFAGLKIDTTQNIAQIKKDVDFCIGKEVNMNIGGVVSGTTVSGGKNEVFRIPAISVEVKTYVDATMLGEIMNTSRKIKGANPGSKAFLLTCTRNFADEHLLEAAYDSSIDEIIVLGTKKRKKGVDPIEFTKEGLCDYYKVIKKAMLDVNSNPSIQQVGRLLAYIKHLI